MILDPNHVGLVLALSARIYVIVASDDSERPDEGVITVTSPQFLDAEWKYKASVNQGTLHLENLYSQFFKFETYI